MTYFSSNLKFQNNSVYQRFCQYVHRRQDHQCWPWTGAVRGDAGYGELTEYADKKRKTLSSHRLAWEFVFGPIPQGLLIRHMCHNRLCCNPSHLLLGTAKDNFDDKIRSNRAGNSVMRCGEKNINAKLTKEQVNDIRKIEGQTIRQIAQSYKVSKSLIGAIRNNQIWTHV